MLKLLYKPVAIVAGIVGGLLSGLIFTRVWKVVGRGSDVPAPMDSERGWGEILLAAGLHGAIYALVKTAVDRGAAEWTRKKTGIWPGGTLEQPDKSPDHRQAKPPPVRPGDRRIWARSRRACAFDAAYAAAKQRILEQNKQPEPPGRRHHRL